ncbi:MAG: hypothetical protein MUO42_09755 [Anaerolineaceae bacterium]|nr:hypothetical protein [Anaerolineaceae bacterium]
MIAGNKTHRNDKIQRWLGPVCLALSTSGIWWIWMRVDPRMMAIHYVSGNLFRNSICGFRTFELFESLYAALPFMGWIAAGSTLISIGVTLLRKRWSGFVLVFGFTAIIYALGASLNIREQSEAPHFIYLADAFNHGNLVLEERPPNWQENDWTKYKDEWSVSFPPAPAMLMMPFVEVFGKSFNDVAFTLILGAFNAGLFYELILKVVNNLKDKFVLSKPIQITLTIAFSFGTVHWWLSSFGQVWFTAQIVATFFLLLVLLETFSKCRPFWAALWLSLAALSRPPILFALPAIIWLLLLKNSKQDLTAGLIPLLVAGLGVGFYNYLRYDNPFELGYKFMKLEDLLSKRVVATGSFNPIYLAENLQNAVWKIPKFISTCPYLVMDGWGLSILVSTPVLLLIINAPLRERVVRMSLIGAFLVAIPSLLYYNTGYLQAGYRYALDFLIFLFLPVIAATRGKLSWITIILVILSVVMGFISLINFYLLQKGTV